VNECPDSGPNKGAGSFSDRRAEVCTCWNSRQLINVSTNDAALHYNLSVAGQTGFNKRHSRQLINVSTNDAALHYKLSVAGQTGFNKRPPKA